MSWYIATESVWGFFFCPLLNIAQSLYFKIGLTIFSRIHRASLQQRFITFFSGLQTVTTFPGGYIYTGVEIHFLFCLLLLPNWVCPSFVYSFLFRSVVWRLDPWPHFSCPFGSRAYRCATSAAKRTGPKERIVSFPSSPQLLLAKDDFTWPYRETHTAQTDKRVPKSELGIRMRSRGVWTERKRLF